MALKQREWITIGLGAVVLIGLVIYRLGGSSGVAGPESADSIAGSLGRIREYERAHKTVSEMGQKLNIDIPHASLGDQETAIMEDIAQQGRKRGLAISSLRPVQVTTRGRSSAVKPIQLRIEVAGSFDSIVEFVNDLEASRIPYVVSELHIESGRGRRGQQEAGEGAPPEDPNAQGTGSVRSSMKIQSYLFPDSASVR